MKKQMIVIGLLSVMMLMGCEVDGPQTTEKAQQQTSDTTQNNQVNVEARLESYADDWIEVNGTVLVFNHIGMHLQEAHTVSAEELEEAGLGELDGMFMFSDQEDEPKDIFFSEDTVFEVQEIRGSGVDGVDNVRAGTYRDLIPNQSVDVFGTYQDSVFVAEKVIIRDFVDLNIGS